MDYLFFQIFVALLNRKESFVSNADINIPPSTLKERLYLFLQKERLVTEL